jgi:NodT family efflux transporter outer membrane factor (OMF) lipoprotein
VRSVTNASIGLVGVHHVAHAAHGVNEFECMRVVDFCAQPAYGDFNHIGIAVEIHIPDIGCDLCAAQHFAAALGEQVQQGKFARRQDALDLVRHRFDAGIASDFDVAQAQTQLETTQSQLIDLNVAHAQLEDAIATLIGEPASSFSLLTDGSQRAPPAIPTGVPSQLLERRPDVAAAERRVAASTADVGGATAAFFPDLMLSASGGLESSSLANWLAMPSRFWAIGPALVGTLFDGGRRKQQLASANASSAATIADYRQIVLTSFQQVEDNLAAGQTLAGEAQTQDSAVRSSRHALDVALTRYKAGAVSYLDVIVAQSTALANERAATDIARRRSDAGVALIKALGGIW